MASRGFPFLSALLLAAGMCWLTGCSHLHPTDSRTYIYVATEKFYLRDRVAIIARRVAEIHNGERLTVLKHDRRFYQVRTPDGQVGWLEEHSVLDQAEYDKFAALAKEHAHDPTVATAILRNHLFAHLSPGRKTEHFYLLPENDRLHLLERASIERPETTQELLEPKPLHRRAVRVRHAKRERTGSTIYAEAPPSPDPDTAPDLSPDQPWMANRMEDWWLVRDSAGKVGWVLSRGLDVEIPDDVAQYSEGRRIVGAYLLNTVTDNGERAQTRSREARAKRTTKAERARRRENSEETAAPAGPAAVPRRVGQYLTVTTEWKDGLPYDWDQVRVFIWNTRKHRYETAYRLRYQQGFLPVTIGREMVQKIGEEPTFTIRTSPDGVVTQDALGRFHPQTLNVTQYRLEGGIVRRDTPLPVKSGTAAASSTAKPPARVRRREEHRLRKPHRHRHRRRRRRS